MEYNKNTYAKANDKKVLHKIRKHWVVVSTALLMALGGGAVATTHASAHADDTNSNNGNAASTNTATETPKATLTNESGQTQQSGDNQNAQPAVSTTGRQATSGNTNGLNPNIEKQAAALHAGLLGSSSHNNNNQSVSGQTVMTSKPKVSLLGGTWHDPSNGQSVTTPDKDGLYPSSKGFTWTPGQTNASDGTAMSDDANDYDDQDGSYSDYGRVTVKYVDVKPGDGNQWVGTSEPLTGNGSDNPYNLDQNGHIKPADIFTSAQLKHFLTSIPPLQGPYGTGYHLVDQDNIYDPNNFDSGYTLYNKNNDPNYKGDQFIGGKNQQLTIRVVPNSQPQTPGQIEVEYQNAFNKDVMSADTYTNNNNSDFDQYGFINNPIDGYDVSSWTTSDVDAAGNATQTPAGVNPSNSQAYGAGQAPITKYLSGTRQILHIYLKSASNKDADTVKYINQSDGTQVGNDRTVYGRVPQQGQTPTASDYVDYQKQATGYVPSGYTFDSDTTTVDGKSYSNGVSGDTEFQDNNSGVTYVLVKKGTPSNPVSVAEGTVRVHYQLSDGQGHGTGSDLEEINAVGPDTTPFTINNYTGMAPDGYQYSNHYNTNNVSTFEKNTPQDVYVYVTKNGAIPTQVANDQIQYMSIDPNNPTQAPQTITNAATNNYTFQLYGKPGTVIDYSQYTNNPPQGYMYVRLGTHNATMNSNQNNVILVESTQAPNQAADEGTVQVQYLDEDPGSAHFGKVVYTIDYKGQDGTSFDQSSDWSNAQNFIPAGYTADVNPTDASAQNFVKNQTLIATIQVTNNGDQNGKHISDSTRNTNAQDTIEYDEVDPNTIDPTTHRLKVIYHWLSGQKAVGTSGVTPVNYSYYIQHVNDVAHGMTFYGFGSPMSPDVIGGQIDHLDVIPSDSMPSPITINYINQNGKIVNSLSPDTGSDGQPIDNEPLRGNFGYTYTMQQLNNDGGAGGLRPIPTGYQLVSGQNGMTFTVSNHAQTFDVMVQGYTDNPQTLNVKRVVNDASGNKLFSDVIPVALNGNVGDVHQIDPMGYAPSPSNYYTLDNAHSSGNGNDYNVLMGDNALLQGDNGNGTYGTEIDNGNNDITFTYVENTAKATVTYEDTKSGNVVDMKSIVGTPNTPMSNVYSNDNLTTLIPSGYNLDTSAPNSTNGVSNANDSKLLNNHNYIIYVKNAFTKKQQPTPRPGYGYINVNYEVKDANGHWDPVAIETATGTYNSPFSSSNYLKATSAGGYMPDAYKLDGTGVTTSDASVTQYLKNDPQTYNVHVDNATSSDNSDLGNQVSDMINYVAVKSDGTVDTSVANPYTSVMIHGSDGAPIDYSQYTNMVPQGYNYYGTQSDISSYAQGYNTTTKPIATILIHKAAAYTHNVTPGYDPAKTNNVPNGKPGGQPGTGNTTYDPKDPNRDSATGNYFPWNFTGQSDNSPLDGPENPDDPISKAGYTYSSDQPEMPNNWQRDSDGVLPTGYLPAWVPDKPADKNDASKYSSGYVPSDIIPDGYEPGFVPNGKGSFVPGYVPENPALQPAGHKNAAGKTIPKYVVTKISDGKGGQTNGDGPDVSPFAKDTSAKMTVEYVNAQNPTDVISDVTVDQPVGSSLDFSTPTSSHYLFDIPAGYQYQSVLGQKTSNNYQSDVTSDVDNKTPNITSKNVYQFSDNPHTIQVALVSNAVGTVIYKDAQTGAQVGSETVSGPAGETLDFGDSNGNAHKYMQLLPYNYSNPVLEGSSTSPILNNGGTYTIDVTKGNDNNQPAPQKRVGYDQIRVVYRDANNTSYILGSDTLVGADGTGITDPDSYLKQTTSDGHIPYGYKTVNNQTSVQAALDNAKFSSTSYNDPIYIDVNTDPNQQNGNENGTDKVEYVVVSKDGQTQHALCQGTGSKAGQLVLSDDPDAGSPLTFDVSGKLGSTIDYSPFEDNVPTGYYYDGLGNHSTTIDGTFTGIAANGQPAQYEQVYVRTAPVNTKNTNNQSKVTVNYVDSTNNQSIDSFDVNGYNGASFNENYFEDNAPYESNVQYVFDDSKAPSGVVRFTNSPQTETIYVKPKTNQVKDFGKITVEYVNADGTALPSSVTHQTVNLYKLNNTLFDPETVEEKAPQGYTFESVLDGTDVRSFDSNNDQVVKVAVVPETNN